VALEGEADEAVDELVVGHARRRPQLREHRPRREAGDGVDLVDEQAPPRLLVEEVHAGHALGPQRGGGGDGQGPDLVGHPGGQLGGDDERGAVPGVLVVVVVELGAGDDLTGDRGRQLPGAEHAALDLPADDRLLDDDPLVEGGGGGHGGEQPLRSATFETPTEDPRLAGLTNTG
jgi:hypothetical protein